MEKFAIFSIFVFGNGNQSFPSAFFPYLVIFAIIVEKNLYIISSCNGAGKTTASFTILPEILDCKEFVNADEIAKGLSPFQPEKVSFEAGRIMLHRISELVLQNEIKFNELKNYL